MCSPWQSPFYIMKSLFMIGVANIYVIFRVLSGRQKTRVGWCTIDYIVSYFQQNWTTNYKNKKFTSFYTKHTAFRGNHFGGNETFDKILTFYLHCSNIKVYTYYIVHTFRSWITVHLIYFFPQKFPIPPPVLLLLWTPWLLIFIFFSETTEKHERYVIRNVSTDVCNQYFFFELHGQGMISRNDISRKNLFEGMIIENNAIYVSLLFAEQNSNSFLV